VGDGPLVTVDALSSPALTMLVISSGFGVGALINIATGLAGGAAGPMWRVWVFTMPLVAWALVPAWAGPVWHAVAVACTASVAAVELTRLRSRAGVSRAALAGWLVLLVVCAASLAALGNKGFGHIVFLFASVELCDSFAFLVGRSLGRRPLAPTVSPNKTWEGLAGGVIAAALSGAVMAPVIQASAGTGAGLGAGLGLAAVLADLHCSARKRAMGVKDFAEWVPVHGSVLDAYDAYLLVAPLWLVFVSLA